jgi:hypothetical protein
MKDRQGRIRTVEVLAGVLGCLAGLVGFSPFLLFGKRLRERFAQTGTPSFKSVLLVPVLSFILMVAALALCWLLARTLLMIFAVACIVVFLVATTLFTVWLVKR